MHPRPLTVLSETFRANRPVMLYANVTEVLFKSVKRCRDYSGIFLFCKWEGVFPFFFVCPNKKPNQEEKRTIG